MPVVWKDFDSYQISYVSDSGFTTGYVNACEVNCFKDGTFVARICFYKEGKAMPANTLNAGAPYIFYPLSQFIDVIDVLRYEKPLGIYVDTDSHVGALSTGQEPVGEQEG
jgi:hypothetical protein